MQSRTEMNGRRKEKRSWKNTSVRPARTDSEEKIRKDHRYALYDIADVRVEKKYKNRQ